MDWVLVSVTAIGLVAVGMVIAIMRMNDYIVIRRELTSTGTRLIHQTLARVAKDENRVEYLRLFSGKREERDLPLPPQEAVDYNPKKKKKVVEYWWSPEMGAVFIQDTDKVKGFQPLTTKQRSFMVNQLKKKEARKTHSWKENIPLIVGLTALVMIVTVILLFWGDAVQPMFSLTDRLENLIDKVDILLQRTAAVEHGTQIITPPA